MGGWEEYDHETFIKFRTRFHVSVTYADISIPSI